MNTLLHRAIRANSIFSGLSGITMLLFAQPINDATDIPYLQFLGINLLVFAAFLYWLTRQENLNPLIVGTVIALDFAWVILSWGIIFLDVWTLTTVGAITVGVIADIVLIFGLLQSWGLRRVLRSA